MPQLPNISLTSWTASPGVDARTGVLCLHGIESHSGWFAAFARALNERGIDCHAYDRAGSGSRQLPYNQEFDSPAYHLEELAAAVQMVRARHERMLIVGMSWGGLLALHAVQRNMLPAYKVLLIAPGIFPLRSLPLMSLVKALLGSVLSGPCVPLPYESQDFSSKKSVQRYIAGDPLRRTKVATKLLLTTLAMQKDVRRGLTQGMASMTEVWLPDQDRIIDLKLTREFFDKQNVRICTAAGHSHCLVLECPDLIASAIADAAQGDR